MNLFELFATITLDDSGYKKGLGDAQKLTEKLGSSIKSGLATAAKIGTAAISTAAAGIAALTKASVENYAEYEQLVGGVETLFKNSADTVMNYASEAYRTAGLSANAYMETVTSFSASLLQSLEGNTEAAAKKADRAITDMADNANKMGSSLETLQTAYAGFAKGQFMLLDNLKLGYGGTQEEMKRLLADAEKISGIKYDISSYADIVDAIHVIQTEMGITGTTAKEAGTTISGALAAAGAAWKNILSGVADENADFEKLIGDFVVTLTGDGTENNLGVFGTLLPRIETALSGIGELVEKIVPQAIEIIPDLISDTLPKLISAAGSMVGAIGQGLLDNASSIITFAQQLITDFTKGILDQLPDIVQAGVDIIVTFTNGVTEMWKELFPAVVDAIMQVADVLTDGENLDKMIDAAIDLAIALGDGLIDGVPKIIVKIPEIIEKIVSKLIERAPDIVEAGIDLISHLLEDTPTILLNLSKSIADLILGIGDSLVNHDWEETGTQIIESVIKGAKNAWNAWEGFGETLFNWSNDEYNPSSGGGTSTGGNTYGGRRGENGNMYVTYNINAPAADQDVLDKSAQRFWNDYAYGH